MVSTAKLVNSALQCARYVEIVCFGEVSEHASSFAKTLLLFELSQLLVICGAVGTASLRMGEVTGFLWVLSSVVYRAVHITFSECRQCRASLAIHRIEKARALLVSKRCSFEDYKSRIRSAKRVIDHRPPVPVHVGFTIKRTGEFSMLMLGEGVLQTIILPVITNHEETHVSAFVLCALVLSFVQLINFRYLPYEPDQHAARRSIHRALILVQVTTLYQASLVWLGVGLKGVLKYHYKLSKDKFIRFSWLFCASLSISLLTLVLIKGLNMGVEEMFYVTETNSSKRLSQGRLLAWLVNLLVPIGIFVLPLLQLNGLALLGLTLFILILFFLAVKLNVGVAIADAVHEAVYSKDGLLSSIHNLATTLERVRAILERMDLSELDEREVNRFASRLVSEVARMDQSQWQQEDSALELVKLLLIQRHNSTGAERISLDSGPLDEIEEIFLDDIDDIPNIKVDV